MIVTYPVNLLQDPQFIIKEVKNYSYKKKTTYAVKTQYKQDVNLEITLSGEFLEDFRFAIISWSSTTYLYGGVKNLIEKKYGSESDNIDDVIITRFLKVWSVLDVKRIFEWYVVWKLEDGKDHKIESIGSVRTSYSLPTHRVVIEYLRKDKPLVGNEFVKHKMTYIKEFQKDSMWEWNWWRSISKERMYSERQRKVIEQEEESHAEKMQLQLQWLQRDFIACKTNRYSVDTWFGPRYAIVIQWVEQGKCKVDHYYIAASKEEEKNDDIFTKKMTCMYDIGQWALSYQEQAQNMMANDWNNCVGSLADFFRWN